MAREHGLGTSDNTIPHLPRIVVIILLVMLPLLCICGLVRRFCPNCRELQHNFRTADHQTSPSLPSVAPLENIWVTSLDPPPAYSQVGLLVLVQIPNVFHSWVSNVQHIEIIDRGVGGVMNWEGGR
jgi:hypothetical protein